MKINITNTTLLSAALAAFLLPAAAQTSSTTPPSPSVTTAPSSPSTPTVSPSPNVPTQKAPETGQRINQRKENQQDRISGGIDHGELTPGETHTLEKQEGAINQEERDMRATDNGHLTSADRTALQQQQNHMSKEIYQDKHNAAGTNVGGNTPPTTHVGKREAHEQQRIAGGIKSGELTPSESANLEKREANINQEVKSDRAANGGHLTQAEKDKIQHQQNKVGHQIYKEKHNGRHQ